MILCVGSVSKSPTVQVNAGLMLHLLLLNYSEIVCFLTLNWIFLCKVIWGFWAECLSEFRMRTPWFSLYVTAPSQLPTCPVPDKKMVLQNTGKVQADCCNARIKGVTLHKPLACFQSTFQYRGCTAFKIGWLQRELKSPLTVSRALCVEQHRTGSEYICKIKKMSKQLHMPPIWV